MTLFGLMGGKEKVGGEEESIFIPELEWIPYEFIWEVLTTWSYRAQCFS
jgi:hypothetical protein